MAIPVSVAIKPYNIVGYGAFREGTISQSRGFIRKATFSDPNPSVLLCWGRKKSYDMALRLQRYLKWPLWSMEEGFLRHVGPIYITPETLSFIIDKSGLYLDARTPSDLETLILETDCTGALMDRAHDGIKFIRAHRLSKYNHAPDMDPTGLGIVEGAILVMDQTVGDASVTYGGADTNSFHTMLNDAIRDNPGRQIVVKTHPDVIQGTKQGYLTKAIDANPMVKIIGDLINPWSLFDMVEKVYTVTSLTGFEALMAGKKVYCYGHPFYAGWGLTEDAAPLPRRQQVRSLEQVFAAAYLCYPSYANPITQQLTTFEWVATYINEQKKMYHTPQTKEQGRYL